MNHLLAPLFTIGQATIFGLGIIAIVPLLSIPVRRWPKEICFRQRLLWLFGLPLPWVILAYWTSFHWHQPYTTRSTVVLAGPLAWTTLGITIVLAVASVALNEKARRFFTAWGLINVWFAAVGALVCLMATSGNWL